MDMRDATTYHTELKRAFGFPDYYGANWDAFDECFGDRPQLQRLAVICVMLTPARERTSRAIPRQSRSSVFTRRLRQGTAT